MADEARSRKLGRRYGVVVLAVIALAFTASSTYQIMVQCFDLAVSTHAPPDECVRGIRTLEAALDQASSRAARERDDEAVQRAWETGLLPEWSLAPSIEKTCDATPEGTQAYASLVRLRRAYEGLLRRRDAEVRPLRESLEAQLAPR